MGKYKIGDKVKIRSDMTVDERYGLVLNSHMSLYAGTETTILKTCSIDDTYLLEIDNGNFIWHEKMLEPVSKFKVGDRVRVKVRTGRSEDYPYGFVNEMANCSGKEFQIREVMTGNDYKERKYYEEPFYYCLRNNEYNWASSMLELVTPAKELTSVISGRCDTSVGFISTADYATDCASRIVPWNFKESKSEYVPSYKLETQNNYNLNFNLK